MPTIRCRPLFAILTAALLSACAATQNPGPGAAGEPAATPAAAPAAAAPEPEAPPLEMHEASAQCWMKYDKTGGSLDAKSKLVDKCIDEKMKAQKPRTAPLAR
jgi:hypothetical protein